MSARRSTSRIVLGLVAAAVVGLLGPGLLAVAGHSQNESGNLPVETTVEHGSHLTGSATWEPDGAFRYRFEVVSGGEEGATVDDSETEAHRRASGEAVATMERCDETGACMRERSWRAPLGSVSTDGATFISDPSLSAAVFRGWLRDEQTGRGCRFEITWLAELGTRPSLASQGSADLRELTVQASATAVRPARARVEAECWNTAYGALGEGGGALARAELVPAAAETTAPHLQEVCPSPAAPWPLPRCVRP